MASIRTQLSKISLIGLKSQNLRSGFCREFQTFTLPDLPYDYSALETVISGEIMQLHHQKHHQTYITNYNKSLEQLHEAMEKGDSQTVEGGGEPPIRELGEAIDANFGSLERLVQKTNAEGAALQGSGWVWLGLDKEMKRLVVQTTANQASVASNKSQFQQPLQDPLVTKGATLVPLLGVDVWEHAYYLQATSIQLYKNLKPDYLKNIWKVMNWKYASEMYEKECS
ncbi:hypothetical protein MKX03_014868 [Papaver bracteatum]|nr:hypothetical protein MKX03_014868 [Papaver bracteatum]